MKRNLRALTILLACLASIVTPLAAQDATLPAGVTPEMAAAAAANPAFGMGLGLGAETIGGTSWQKVNLTPDFSIGKFGVGLDLTLHYKLDLSPAATNAFQIYTGDWDPAVAGISFLDLYLPKIKYLRYGLKGEPFFVKLGSIDDGTLGNGYIMGNYSNARFLPDRKIFGGEFDLDGALFNFPLVGIESFVDNLALFDLVGGRFFIRPLAYSGIPILNGLQIGASVVADLAPYTFSELTPPAGAQVMIYGGDFRLPILSSDVVSLAAYGDFVMENQAWGAMVGAGGRLFGLLTYGAQVRLNNPGFIPDYFDSTYDLSRVARYAAFQSLTASSAVTGGWFASLGTTLFADKILFNVMVDGPFAALPAAPSANIGDYPRIRGVLSLAEGLLAGFSFDAIYEKSFLGKTGDFFGDLVSPKDAFIEAKINYATGGAVITLAYDLRYDEVGATDVDPATPDFIITSSLTCSIKLF